MWKICKYRRCVIGKRAVSSLGVFCNSGQIFDNHFLAGFVWPMILVSSWPPVLLAASSVEGRRSLQRWSKLGRLGEHQLAPSGVRVEAQEHCHGHEASLVGLDGLLRVLHEREARQEH